MKAITTRYFGPTNTKPSRIKASAEGVPSKTYPVEYLHQLADLPLLGNAQRAAHCFALSRNWSTNLASGQLPNGDWVHCFIPVEPEREKQLLQNLLIEAEAVLEGAVSAREKLRFRVNEARAHELSRLGRPEAEIFRASRCASDLGQAVSNNLNPRTFTVVTVSSNTNSFGYKSVLVLTEDGTVFGCLYQAYGTDPVPARGDKIEEAKLPTYCRRELPRTTPEKAAKILKEIK